MYKLLSIFFCVVVVLMINVDCYPSWTRTPTEFTTLSYPYRIFPVRYPPIFTYFPTITTTTTSYDYFYEDEPTDIDEFDSTTVVPFNEEK